MIGLAIEIARQAGAAIAELTGGRNGDAVTAEHADDRLADRDLVFDAAFREPDAERLILDNPDGRRREIFGVRGARRPFLRSFGRSRRSAPSTMASRRSVRLGRVCCNIRARQALFR